MVLDLETTPIIGQVASAILDLQGNLMAHSTTIVTPPATTQPAVTPSHHPPDERTTTIRNSVSSSSSTVMDRTTIQVLYQMFLEVGTLQLSSFRRMTVVSSSLHAVAADSTTATTATNSYNIRYIVSRDETNIYIVAQKQAK
jgi:hypothetical protein